ncbi:MAG: hypothetical protein ACOYMB_01310 [Patescibacteria group bacterium]
MKNKKKKEKPAAKKIGKKGLLSIGATLASIIPTFTPGKPWL